MYRNKLFIIVADILTSFSLFHILQREIQFVHYDLHLKNNLKSFKSTGLREKWNLFVLKNTQDQNPICILLPKLHYEHKIIDYEFASHRYMKNSNIDCSFHLLSIGIFNPIFFQWADAIRYTSCLFATLQKMYYQSAYSNYFTRIWNEWVSVLVYICKQKGSIQGIFDTNYPFEWYKTESNFKKYLDECPIDFENRGILKLNDPYISKMIFSEFETELHSIYYNVIGLLLHHIKVDTFRKKSFLIISWQL